MGIERSSCVRVSPTILGHDPCLAHVSSIQRRSNHRDVSTRFLGELPLGFIMAVEFHLKPFLCTCLDEDRVDSGPRDRRLRVYRDHIRRLQCFHVTCRKKELPREHSPTWKKWERLVHIKRKEAVSICVTTPINLPGPTNP